MSEVVKHDLWQGTTYGNNWMHKWLIRMLKVVDVRFLYGFTAVFIIPPTLVINGKARKSIYNFYRKGFNYGRWKSWIMTFRNHYEFSRVVIDRFAMYAGKKFDIEIVGYDAFERLARCQGGFIQLGSHLGNYELAGYSLVAREKRFNALVFGGEKQSIMNNRLKMFKDNNIRMVPMMADMSYLFTIDKALDDGEIISMPADRMLGSQKYFSLDLLGHKVHLPQGPFVLSVVKEVPVLTVFVVKTGAKKYLITVKELDKTIDLPKRDKGRNLAEQYASILEETVKAYPTQWYNYFNIWAE